MNSKGKMTKDGWDYCKETPDLTGWEGPIENKFLWSSHISCRNKRENETKESRGENSTWDNVSKSHANKTRAHSVESTK